MICRSTRRPADGSLSRPRSWPSSFSESIRSCSSIWPVKRSRSSTDNEGTRLRTAVVMALLFAVVPVIASIAPSVVAGDAPTVGTVNGNVLATTSGVDRIENGGVVTGSVRATSPQVRIDGEVGKDLLFAGIAGSVGSTGVASRDVIMFGGTLTLDGAATCAAFSLTPTFPARSATISTSPSSDSLSPQGLPCRGTSSIDRRTMP